MKSKVGSLQRKIEQIKKKLATLGDLRPGSLSEQYNVCGNPRCRCKANPPQKHGPYYQLSWTRKRKSKTRFVKKHQLHSLRSQMKNYELLQSLLDQWIEASIELCDLQLKLEAEEASARQERG
jgi:hypothetical protein